MMPLIFGLSFQTPLVMMFLHKVGIVTVEMLREYRRGAWFSLAIIAALLAPAPTADGLLLLWVPMVALYELGILLCVWQGKRESLAEWEQEEKSNEMVEV
jgi:sec-independent protein translocase protein TatC